MTIAPSIEDPAKLLAGENRRAEAAITKVFWFPHSHEVRFIALSEEVPGSDDREVHPFYFRASPQDGLTGQSAVAVVRPAEFGKLKLPRDWVDWRDAIEV